MKMKLTPEAAARLYGGRLHAVVAEEDAVAGGLLETLRRLQVPALRFSHGVGLWLEGDDPAASVRIPAARPPSCVLLARSAEAAAALERLARFWEGLPVRRVGTPEECAAALLQHLEGELEASAGRESDLRRQLTALRQELDETRTVMARLASLVEGHTPQRLAVTLDPGERGVAGRVRQVLPVGAWELAGIDVYWLVEGRGGGLWSKAHGGEVAIRLLAMDDGSVLGQWQVPLEQALAGWMRLPFAKVLASSHHFLELEAEWPSRESSPGLSLALSPAAVSGGESAISGDGEGVAVGQPLALRLWAGIAGTPLPPHPGASARVLYQVDLGRAELVSDTPREYFSILDHGRRLRLHPVPGAVAVARIPAAGAAGMRRIAARVITNHPKGPRIEYALWLAARASQDEQGTPPALVLAPPSKERFSGWVAVPPDLAAHELAVELAAPARESLDVYLATRYPPKQPHEYAWADWLAVEVALEYPG